MVKNEEFYSRAQKARDYYKEKKLYSYSNIVKKLQKKYLIMEMNFLMN